MVWRQRYRRAGKPFRLQRDLSLHAVARRHVDPQAVLPCAEAHLGQCDCGAVLLARFLDRGQIEPSRLPLAVDRREGGARSEVDEVLATDAARERLVEGGCVGDRPCRCRGARVHTYGSCAERGCQQTGDPDAMATPHRPRSYACPKRFSIYRWALALAGSVRVGRARQLCRRAEDIGQGGGSSCDTHAHVLRSPWAPS